VIGLEAAYFFVLAVLYLWMRNRAAPFKLLTIMRIYNFLCAALAGVVVVGILLFPPVSGKRVMLIALCSRRAGSLRCDTAGQLFVCGLVEPRVRFRGDVGLA
jgi:hypothetical protein